MQSRLKQILLLLFFVILLCAGDNEKLLLGASPRENADPQNNGESSKYTTASAENLWESGKITQRSISYKDRMRSLIIDLKTYAKEIKGDFFLIANNGCEIYYPEEDNMFHSQFINAIDGILIEEHFYGWDNKDNLVTSLGVQKEVTNNLSWPLTRGIPIFNIDYCTGSNAEMAYRKNSEKGLIPFVAPSRGLEVLPYSSQGIFLENSRDILTTKDARNFLVLLNPCNFANKNEYIKELANTNYDLLVLDLFFHDEPLTSKDLELLKMKKNGGRRLVMSYLSVGEAEDYRSYWQTEWDKNPPDWLGPVNENWEGNYKVKYWHPIWQKIAKEYLEKIIKADFDGAMLDVIDTFQYFESEVDNS